MYLYGLYHPDGLSRVSAENKEKSFSMLYIQLIKHLLFCGSHFSQSNIINELKW